MKNKIIYFILLSVFMIGFSKSIKAKFISALDKKFYFEGVKYIKKTDNGIIFRRFSDEVLKLRPKVSGFNPKKATGTTGIKIFFKTDSSKITLFFKPVENSLNQGAQFGVSINGKWFKSFNFWRKAKDFKFTIEPDSGKKVNEYEIDLPSFADVEFSGIEINNQAKLYSIKRKKKKVYVALGDSITHGRGQKSSSFLTYPFLLAEKLNYELYNLAVGGGKISVPAGEMLKDWNKIDLITILIGYNDLHSAGKSIDRFKNEYNKLIDAIRKNHPKTPVFCISPLFTRKPVSKKTGINIVEFRKVVENIVQQRRQNGDKNIYLIKGDEITSEEFLRTDRPDPVHLSPKGASMLADRLYEIIVKTLKIKK